MRNAAKTVKTSDVCLILGNGPSINDWFNQFKVNDQNGDILVVNFFALTDYFNLIKPQYYILADPDFFRNTSNLELEEQKIQLTQIFNSVSWKMVLFIPTSVNYRNYLQTINNNNIYVLYFNTTPINGFSSIENFLFRNNLGMPIPETVIIAAVFLSLNLGYRSLHLHGAEHSWLRNLSVNDNNEIIVGLNHFYQCSDLTDEKRNLSDFLMSQVRLFNGHTRLRLYADYLKSDVINYTPNSMIDAYVRRRN